MFIGGILRVCAIVSLSAVSIISSMLKAKVEGPGMINPSACNSNPYNSNTGVINMYNNGAFSSQSRRFYGCAQPSYPMANVPTMGQTQQQSMRPITFGSPLPQPSIQLQMALLQNGYPVPGYNANAYQGGYNAQAMYGYTPSMYSRRNMVPGTYPQQPPQQMNYNNYNQMNQYMSNDMYREPSYGMNYNYGNNNGYGYDSGVSALYGNSYNYGYTQSYQQPMMNYMYQQPQQQPVQSLGNYNSSIVGSAARYSYWTPSSDSSYAYYGYDDNVASYPTSYPQQSQPQQMYQPQQPMPQQMYQQPQIPAGYTTMQWNKLCELDREMRNSVMQQNVPPQPQIPAGYTSEQWNKLCELDKEIQRHYRMHHKVPPQPQMPDGVPSYMRHMDGRLHDTIRPMNVDNGSGWYTKEEQDMARAQSQATVTVNPPMPQPNVPPYLQNGPARFYQQPQPQQQMYQQQEVEQQPSAPKISTGNPIMDKMLESLVIPEADPQEVANAPIPTHVMKFGPPDDSEPQDMTKIVPPFCTFDDQPEKPKGESRV